MTDAYDARPAASDDVERVARALAETIIHYLKHSLIHGINGAEAQAILKMTLDRDTVFGLARVAIDAMGERDLRIGAFVLRRAPSGIWIGRTDGEGGEFATEHVERVIAQFYREQF